jgi:hypothetical protein
MKHLFELNDRVFLVKKNERCLCSNCQARISSEYDIVECLVIGREHREIWREDYVQDGFSYRLQEAGEWSINAKWISLLFSGKDVVNIFKTQEEAQAVVDDKTKQEAK